HVLLRRVRAHCTGQHSFWSYAGLTLAVGRGCRKRSTIGILTCGPLVRSTMRAQSINVLPKKPGCRACASPSINDRSAFVISSTRFVLFVLLAPAWIVGLGGCSHRAAVG